MLGFGKNNKREIENLKLRIRNQAEIIQLLQEKLRDRERCLIEYSERTRLDPPILTKFPLYLRGSNVNITRKF